MYGFSPRCTCLISLILDASDLTCRGELINLIDSKSLQLSLLVLHFMVKLRESLQHDNFLMVIVMILDIEQIWVHRCLFSSLSCQLSLYLYGVWTKKISSGSCSQLYLLWYSRSVKYLTCTNYYNMQQYTFILTASKALPKQCTKYGTSNPRYASRKSVGVRVPDDAVCQAILEKIGAPLISTRYSGI